jgi:hypothetical protein
MPINWEAIGAVGEIGGAIGVIVTLVYLAGQLKQNTRALQSSAYQTYNERTDSFWDFEAQHAALLGSIYENQKDYDVLTSEEKSVLNASMMKSFNLLEGMFLHHQTGTLNDEVFHAKADGFKASFRSPLIHDAWRRLSPTMAFTREFRQFMDTEMFDFSETDDKSYHSSFRKAD